MGKWRNLKDVGLKKAPSAFALFVQEVSKKAVQDPPRTRLKIKSSSAKFKNMTIKWKSMEQEKKVKWQQKAKEMAKCVQLAKKNIMANDKVRQKENNDDSTGAQNILEDDAKSFQSFPWTPEQPRGKTCAQDTLFWSATDRLSEGAYGQVYKVTSKHTGQQYAMKLAKPGAEGELLKENDVLRHVSNPHVIASFGYFADGSTHALLLELWDHSLYDWLGGLEDAPSTSETKLLLTQNLRLAYSGFMVL